MKITTKSPYLKNPQRLSDVIAAIQVMAMYKFYKLDCNTWAKRITGSEASADGWKDLFIDHPEFFRFDSENKKVSLVWRRSYQRKYHVDLDKNLSVDELNRISDQEKIMRLSRTPLSSDDTAKLISTAIDLHSRAIENEKEKRWLLPSLVTILAVLLGALLKN